MGDTDRSKSVKGAGSARSGPGRVMKQVRRFLTQTAVAVIQQLLLSACNKISLQPDARYALTNAANYVYGTKNPD